MVMLLFYPVIIVAVVMYLPIMTWTGYFDNDHVLSLLDWTLVVTMVTIAVVAVVVVVAAAAVEVKRKKRKMRFAYFDMFRSGNDMIGLI